MPFLLQREWLFKKTDMFNKQTDSNKPVGKNFKMRHLTKILPLLIILLSFNSVLHAQDSHAFGVRAGYNDSGLNGNLNGISERNSRVSYSFAGFYRRALFGNFFLQPELALHQKGSKEDVALPGGRARFFTTFTYLDLPVLAGYTFSPENVSFSVISGFVTGYNLSAKLSDFNGEKEGIREIVNKVNVAVTGGGELRFNMFNKRFALNARYESGLRSVFNIPEIDFKMTTYTMTLGFEL